MTDPAAERAVLAAIFAYGRDAYVDVSDLVTPRTFTVDSNGIIYRCLESLLEQHPDARPDLPSILSTAAALGLSERLASAQEVKHLRAVMSMPVELSGARRLAVKIRKLEVARELSTQLDRARESLAGVTGEEGMDQIMGIAQNPIFDFTMLLASSEGDGPRRMGEGAEEYLLHLMEHPREYVGISTGLKRYDEAIGGGLRPNAVDVIAARAKAGKTFVGDNIALHIAQQDIPVLNIDLEMTWEEHLHRVVACLGKVPARAIEQGKAGGDPVVKARVLEATRRLKDMPYDYDCAIGRPFEEVLARARRWLMKTVGLGPDGKAKPCAIILDYLKLQSAEEIGRAIQEYQALGFMMTALKNFVGRYGIACLCFAQLNREGLTRDDISAIASSDRINWFATSVSLYKAKDQDEMAEEKGREVRYTHKIVVGLTRHGAGLQDGDYINVAADYALGKIAEGPTRFQLNSARPPAGFTLEGQQDDIPFPE